MKSILNTLALTLPLILCSALNAQTITAVPSDKTFEDIKITATSTLEDNGLKTTLKNASHGLRKVKKFGLVNFSVYAIEVLAQEPTKLIKTKEGILESLKTAGPIQLRFTFARDLKGSQISESFKEALKANDIDTEKASAELTSLLTTLNSIEKFKKGDVFTLTSTWKDNTATLYIQRPDLSIQKISGPEKFVTDLFSIWFGKPVDDKMEDLKKALIK